MAVRCSETTYPLLMFQALQPFPRSLPSRLENRWSVIFWFVCFTVASLTTIPLFLFESALNIYFIDSRIQGDWALAGQLQSAQHEPRPGQFRRCREHSVTGIFVVVASLGYGLKKYNWPDGARFTRPLLHHACQHSCRNEPGKHRQTCSTMHPT